MAEQASPDQVQQVVIITGLSGAGRRTVAHTMEDLGWYVVDNLPPTMLPALAADLRQVRTMRVAVVLDVRSRTQFVQIPAALEELEKLGVRVTILFIESTDEVIVQRQESSRRPLPLQYGGRLLDGIARERRLLADLRAQADLVVDTTKLGAKQLANRIANHFGTDESDGLQIALMSFGFKNGLPVDADMVFDVRFLPNPFWVPELRPQTGLSEAVSTYVLTKPEARSYTDGVEALVSTVAPGYVREGKRQVTVAIGCTGGKHRSVAITEHLAGRLRTAGYSVTVIHRDLGKE